MKAEINEWLAYPENIPEHSGRYIVTTEYYVQKFASFSKQYNAKDKTFYGGSWINDDRPIEDETENIIAFMQIPPAYRAEEK